jgi:epoxyqueuosine reductase
MISLEDIREKALTLGWHDVGVTTAQVPEEDAAAYLSWVEQGYHGEMRYMERADQRCDMEDFFPRAKSVVIFVSSYRQETLPFRDDAGLIASYARGRDYHNVYRKRLKKMVAWLEEISSVEGCARGFSDTAPVLERAFAVKAGMGFFGKNNLFIHKKLGSFVLLAGVVTMLEIEGTDIDHGRRKNHCGTCSKCIEACPGEALLAPYRLDARRCLAYHLIESKKPLPRDLAEKNPGYIFGCDICQDVCPHNAKKDLLCDEQFLPGKGRGAYLTEDELVAIQEQPERLHGTPLQRQGAELLRAKFPQKG